MSQADGPVPATADEDAPLLREVERAVALDRLVAASEVPRTAGIYAAWISSNAALGALGIAGPAPVLAYVGKAAGGGGNLRRRLTVHSSVPFFELMELLALRGHAIFPWHARARHAGNGRMYRATPLSDIAMSTGLAFQHTHLRWAWQECDPEQARMLERRAIAAGRPLLNRASAGPVPPQLRRRDGYERDADRWLWHTAWAALYLASDPSSDRDPASPGFALNQDGWPVNCAAEGAMGAPPQPTGRKIRRLVRSAANHRTVPAGVREAVKDAPAEELEAWWSGHAGASYLQPSIEIHDAIRQSLAANPKSAFGSPPPRTGVDEQELLQLISGLGRVCH